MISIILLASILLVFHVVSTILIALVIKRQWKLFRVPIPKEYSSDASSIRKFRKLLFFLSIAILIGNIIPIVIDVLTLFIETGRPANLRIISIFYSVSNATTALISATLVWLLYFSSFNAPEAVEIKKTK